MFSHQTRIITASVLSTFALTCSSALRGERALSNQTAPAPQSVAMPAPQPQREAQGAPAQDAGLPLPVLPLIVHYEYVPHYFVQWINDHPQYTRPRTYRGRSVPDVLVQGDHQAIARWRRERALERTRERRARISLDPALEDAGPQRPASDP